jgi:serine/threonine protein kinase
VEAVVGDGVLENVPVVGSKRTFPRAFGRYILEKSLSRGGMGEVFLTVAKGVNQRCVIKTIRGDLTGDEEFVGRFADEAKIMMRIQHPNIIRVFDAGRVGADYYIAMEFVHGRDLGDVLDRAYERGEAMPTQLGLYVAEKLLDGLDYAHKLCDERGRPMGVVHRDISPQNVLIGFDGSVKLIDFGLARTDLLPARTQGALAVGKYGYMSPEQARHEKIDGRADIYSTGVMLFEVFTGDRLVDEQDQATLWSRVLSPKHRKPSTSLATLSAEIDELVMSAVAVKSDDRFNDAAEMRRFIQSLRRQDSNREDFVRYLRYLYPKVDFSPPPIPDYAHGFDDSEKSMIIATSREGALSVFGRGDLPIEWTTQIDANELQALIKADRRARTGFEREVLTDAHVTDAVEPLAPEGHVEPTYVRTRAEEVRRKASDSRRVGAKTVELRGDAIGDEETRYARGPRGDSDEDDGGAPAPRAGTDSATEHRAPVLGTSRVATAFRDDEMTVMMDAPPRHLVVARTAAVEFSDEETRAGDAPTRLSQPAAIVDPAVIPATPGGGPVVSKGRAIQEKNSAQRPVREENRTNLRTDRDRAGERPAERTERSERGAERGGDRTDRIDRTDRGADRPGERGAATKSPGAKPSGRVVAHKATVGTDLPPAPPPPAKRAEETMPPAGAAEGTEGEIAKPAALGVWPAVILVGLLVVIVLLVLLLLKV